MPGMHFAFPSPLQAQRQRVPPVLPSVLRDQTRVLVKKSATSAAGDAEEIKKLFPFLYGQKSVSFQRGEESDAVRPIRAAVVLSGGQAPGGHNVITGLFRFVKESGGTLYGFLNGPKGIFTGNYREITDDDVEKYHNMGGFDMIGSGRDKIHTDKQFADSLKTCEQLKLDGLVVIGGDDSNTNACMLAEYFASRRSRACVVGAPKTIDGDLKNEYVPVSFGFDTACKTYSEMIGSLAMDALSTKKKYHFVRLMGRSASHIALECALQVQPNLCYIGEEVEHKRMTLSQVARELVDLIETRASVGKKYGLVLIPEGLIEFIPELGVLIKEINDILPKLSGEATANVVLERLSGSSKDVFAYLPDSIKSQLLLDRDSHGNVIVSRIETESLLIQCALKELCPSTKAEFKYQTHFFGYEGRSALPSPFDSNYCFALGYNAGLLINHKQTGMISTVTNLNQSPELWEAGGMPLTHMMNMEKRAGKEKPVIKKALTELDGNPFLTFARRREQWKLQDKYRSPGPIQFQSTKWAEDTTIMLRLELEQREGLIEQDSDQPRAKRHKLGSRIGETGRDADATFSLPFVRNRLNHSVKSPSVLHSDAGQFRFVQTEMTPVDNAATLQFSKVYPHLLAQNTSVYELHTKAYSVGKSHVNTAGAPCNRVGIVFCGRPTPGAHNIVQGLYDALKLMKRDTVLYGFKNGTLGLFEGNYVEITDEIFEEFRNTGGVDILGRSVDQMHTDEQLKAINATCCNLSLDGLVCVGGTYTAADTLCLAEFLLSQGTSTTVTALPATIDRDMINQYVEETVGFHSASRVCSQLCGNIATDCNSNKKYYYFLRMMGRRPSHMVLEVGLQSCPNAVLIGEEIWENQKTLSMIVTEIADMVCLRSLQGKEFGVILIPEGLLTFVPEVASLLTELKNIGAQHPHVGLEETLRLLKPWQRMLFEYLPGFIQDKVTRREIHGTLELSQIETEKMLLDLVKKEMKRRSQNGTYNGKFGALTHFFGYQARCGFPTEFDCMYGNALGRTAAYALTCKELTGSICTIKNLASGDVEKNWVPQIVPLLNLVRINLDTNRGEYSPVVVDVKQGKAFQHLRVMLQKWKLEEAYRNLGPTQFGAASHRERSATLSFH
jgi:6-phosphofructokinase